MTTLAIYGFLTKLKDSLPSRYIEDNFMYDPTLDFRRSVIEKGQLRSNSSSDRQEVLDRMPSTSTWALIAWSRGALNMASSINNRKKFQTTNGLNDPSGLTAEVLDFKMGSIELDISIFTNSIENITNIEEDLFLSLTESGSYSITNADLHDIDFKIHYNGLSTGSLEKLDTKNLGSVTALPLSLQIHYPVIALSETRKTIQEIEYELRLYNTDISNWVLINSETLTSS